MVMLLKLVDWYIGIGMAYALWSLIGIGLSQFIFEHRIFDESFISSVDEERKSKGKRTYAESMEALNTFGVREYMVLIGRLVLCWPILLVEHELKDLMNLFWITR